MNWKKNQQIRMNLGNQETSLRNIPKPLSKKILHIYIDQAKKKNNSRTVFGII